jgi:hypothetical protein
MNDFETKSPMASSNEELQQQCAALQRQITTLLLAVFVISGTLTVFLWRQASLAKKDLQVLKEPAAQIIQTFKQEKPITEDFFARLNEFSKSHPDFAPVLAKYKTQPAVAPLTPSATQAPATATSSPPGAPKK